MLDSNVAIYSGVRKVGEGLDSRKTAIGCCSKSGKRRLMLLIQTNIYLPVQSAAIISHI